MPTLRRRNSDPRRRGSERPCAPRWPTPPGRSRTASSGASPTSSAALVEVVRWPFERIAWAVEHWLVWPIQEETALWSRPVRAGALAGVVVLAAAGVAAGVAVSNPSSGGGSSESPVEASPPRRGSRRPTPGAPPRRRARRRERVRPGPSSTARAPTSRPSPAAASRSRGRRRTAAAAQAATGAKAGAATAVTGRRRLDRRAPGAGRRRPRGDRGGPQVLRRLRPLRDRPRHRRRSKRSSRETATPDLAQALLKRPPRLPANVKVPKAKVLNIVAGPKQGDTYTLSVSLLRVGVTSELRIDMQKTPAGRQGSEPGPSKRSSGS